MNTILIATACLAFVYLIVWLANRELDPKAMEAETERRERLAMRRELAESREPSRSR